MRKLFKILVLVLFAGIIFINPVYAQIRPVNTNEIRDYICIVNRHLHPNMERYLNTAIRGLIDGADEDSDNHARRLEYHKRGGSGSGFVYLDRRGNNFILTNYHVIVGAYRLSVTFENDKEEKTVYSNLYVVNVDESADLALLGFPEGNKPFRKGIPLNTTTLRDDTVIRAAGYPGIPEKPVWNITRGTIVNNRSWPIGREYWFIQHDAAINPGNSGGPLLVEDRNNLRYSVAGMNTFYIKGLQGANYSIPTERINAFIQRSLQQQQENEEVSLRNRLNSFMELLQRSASSEYVYEPLSSYLSSTMINADPLNVVRNLNTDTAIPALKKLNSEVVLNPVNGVPWAVALNQIEMPIYSKSRRPLAQKSNPPEIISVAPNNMGNYTARLLVFGYPYRTEWVREYGTWKLDEFIEDDGEYNDFEDLATVHPLGKKVIYSLSSERDYDWYIINIPRAGKLTIRTEGNLDTRMRLCTDPTNNDTIERTRIGDSNDDKDAGQNYNEMITENVRAGNVYVRIRNADTTTGDYILFAGMDGQIDNIPYASTSTISAAPNSNNPSISIINNTGSTIWYLYLSEATSTSWGQDRMASDQILRNNDSVSVQLPNPINQVNRYDIKLIDSNSNDYIKMNVLVTANGRIVFTAEDMSNE